MDISDLIRHLENFQRIGNLDDQEAAVRLRNGMQLPILGVRVIDVKDQFAIANEKARVLVIDVASIPRTNLRPPR